MQKVINPYVYPGLKFELIPYGIKNKIKSKSFKMRENEILEIVARESDVTVDDIISESRKREHVDARYIYFAIIKLKFRLTLVNIGKNVGNRDHTTVRHGILKFIERYRREENYKSLTDKICELVGADYHGQDIGTYQ